MKYRTFGKLPFKPSALGFGCMRLPTLGKAAEVDEPQAIEMIRWAIDQGVNYIDTAYPYHDGNSERVVGKALAGGYRERAALATKMPIWMVHEHQDLDRLFEEQRARLGVDRIDYYLLHCLQKGSWPAMRMLGALEWLQERKSRGHIGEIGFSFHDHLDVFKEIVDGFDGWTFCQIQYNFLNVEVQAGTEGLRYAAERGLGVVVMEPLFGGALAHPPPPVQAVWDRASRRRSAVEWALHWLWSQPEVSLVLSGMSAPEQVRENVKAASDSEIGLLGEEENALVDEARRAYKALLAIPCTRCGYCLPCPHGVDIPTNFELYNDAAYFGGNVLTLNRNLYRGMPKAERASACENCGECEEKCPQQIPIREWLPRVHQKFS
ncbi:MAG: aldo/keto reductase [Planctomycetes bacterium]|nr:aldo/keto reductase [Planctomycetota bacterium]